MKHLEPQSSSRPKEKEPGLPRKKTSALAMLAAGITLVAGMGFGMNHFWGAPAADAVTDNVRKELLQEYLSMKPVQLKLVTQAEMGQALADMPLPPAELVALKQGLEEVRQGSTDVDAIRLVWVDVWDAVHEDGDIVNVRSAGYQVDVPLRHTRVRVAVPVRGNKAIEIAGVTDGGGGITLGLMTDAGGVMLPVLSPGQPISVPVSY